MRAATYTHAVTLAQAVALLRTESDAAVLAGGQTLLVEMKRRLVSPATLVDIRGIKELSAIRIENAVLSIGATATHEQIADHPRIRQYCRGLAQLAGRLGDPAVRHCGTIGGAVAVNAPAGDYPAAVLALNATIVTNLREIPAQTFFTEAVLYQGELITALKIPLTRNSVYAKFPQPAARSALVGVFIARHDTELRVAVTGAAANGVFRCTELEQALAADWSARAVDAVKISAAGLLSDMHGSAEYRAQLIKEMAKQAVSVW